MKISRELYQTMQNQTAPKSKSWKNIPLAFLIGGLICTIGEAGIHILTDFCRVDLYWAGGSQCSLHRSGLVRQAGQTRRSRHAGAHYRLCKRCGFLCH